MPEPFKNMYNVAFIEALSQALHSAHLSFDVPAFTAAVFDAAWESRELKARMRHISHCLHAALAMPYPQALEVLQQASLHPALAGYSFETMIFPDYVEVYGLVHWEPSIAALEQFTQQSSAEFAVRPFILQDSPRMMAQMLAWASHTSHHVRRLASEGCRPRLPWAMALPAFKQDPSPILPILERLHADESEYVRRSVANNLNDIAKDHPGVVLTTLQQWHAQPHAHLPRLTHHALRTLVKAGDAQALALLGYAAQSAAYRLDGLRVTPSLTVGERLHFTFEVVSLAQTPQPLMIDYGIAFVRANGSRSVKVFKLTRKTLEPAQTLTLTREHSFAPISTRRYYIGEHLLQIQINGQMLAQQAFILVAAD